MMHNAKVCASPTSASCSITCTNHTKLIPGWALIWVYFWSYTGN